MEDKKSLIGMKEIQEYRNFAFKDDVFKLAVGVILGSAFNKLVCGVSDYFAMPIVTFLVSHTGENWRQWSLSPFYGLRFEVGKLLGAFVDFFIISFVLYFFYVKLVGRFVKISDKRKMRPCPLCFEAIDERASRCPRCSGNLNVKTRRTRKSDTRAENHRGK